METSDPKENKNNPFLSIHISGDEPLSIAQAFGVELSRMKELVAFQAPISFEVLTGKKNVFHALAEICVVAETATEMAAIICVFNASIPTDANKLFLQFLKNAQDDKGAL